VVFISTTGAGEARVGTLRQTPALVRQQPRIIGYACDAIEPMPGCGSEA